MLVRPILILASLLFAETASARCYSDEQCPSWQVCSVSLGDCGGGAGYADVCTGTCVAGQRFTFVPRLGASFLGRDVGASAGLELVPPVFGGRFGIAVDYWTQSLVRAGAIATWHALNLVAVAARLDVTRGGGVTGVMGALRVDVCPIRQAPLSLYVEGGVSYADASTTPIGSVGIAVWL